MPWLDVVAVGGKVAMMRSCVVLVCADKHCGCVLPHLSSTTSASTSLMSYGTCRTCAAVVKVSGGRGRQWDGGSLHTTPTAGHPHYMVLQRASFSMHIVAQLAQVSAVVQQRRRSIPPPSPTSAASGMILSSMGHGLSSGSGLGYRGGLSLQPT